MSTLLNDIRFAFRQLRKSPGFTITVVLILALGIGANTAIFSIADAILLRTIQVKNPHDLVEFVRVYPDHGRSTNVPYAVVEYFQENNNVLSGCFAFYERGAKLRGNGDLQQVRVHDVSDSFFPVLGVNALLGRTISPNNGRPGADSQVVVLSHAFWSRQFGLDPNIIGTSIQINTRSMTIIGVMPPTFVGVDRSRPPDIWMPMPIKENSSNVWVLGRLQPGVSIAQVRAVLEPRFQQALVSAGIKEALSNQLEVNSAARGTSGLRWNLWQYSNTLKILIGLTIIVLVATCANLANLLMARSATRVQEIQIRFALGAGRGQLIRQLCTESLMLALMGGLTGLILATWGHQILMVYLIGHPHRGNFEFHLNERILGFTCAVSLLTGLFFGLAPAWWITRDRPGSMIQNTLHIRGTSRLPLARTLVVLQVVLTITALTGAGLFANTLVNLKAANFGFPRENLTLAFVDPPSGMTTDDRNSFWRKLTQRIKTLPSVKSASLAGNLVFGAGCWSKDILIANQEKVMLKAKVDYNPVEPGFFATVGIPILIGRDFNVQDREQGRRVAIVNQTFVNRFFGNENPIGRHFNDTKDQAEGDCEIIGVIPDAKYGHVRREIRPMVYHPLQLERHNRACVLHMSTVGDSIVLPVTIRREILTLDNDIFIRNVTTVNEMFFEQIRQERMFATLATLFGAMILSLAAVGLYGLLAYNVTQRTPEIGIRLALGATPRCVAQPFLCEMLVMTMMGLVVGIPIALAVTSMIRSSLYGIEPHDPVTMIVSVIVLLVVTIAAAWIPARRAAKIDPMEALRYE